MKTETQISDKELELISRSLDEELSELERRRLNQKILNKENGAQVWHRYHAVSAVMNKQFPKQIDKDFSQRVMQEIERDGHQDAAPAHSGFHRVTSTMRHFAGLAVAASVATVSVMSYQYFKTPSVNDQNPIIANEQLQQPNPVNVVPSMAVEFTPAQLDEEQVKPVPNVEIEENIYYQEMSPYIQDHVGYGSQRIMTPYEMIELKDVQE